MSPSMKPDAGAGTATRNSSSFGIDGPHPMAEVTGPVPATVTRESLSHPVTRVWVPLKLTGSLHARVRRECE